MPRVELLGVQPVEVLQAGGQIRDARVDDQVVVRAHQAEREDVPVEELDAVEQEVQEPATVVVVTEDERALDAASPDVEEPVR